MNRLSFIVFFLLFSITASAQRNDTLQLDPEVRRGKLKNGLTYYIRHNNYPEGKIFIQQSFKVGYFNEDPDQLLLAHVVEHVGFQKSRHFDNIFSFFRKQGLVPGNDLNASTGYLSTNYWVYIPSGNDDLLLKSLLVMKDRTGDLTMDSLEIEAERGNVLNEIGRPTENDMPPNDISALLEDTVHRAVHANVGKRNVQRFKIASARRFYYDWYRPDLQSISITGDIDPARAEQLLDSMFSPLQPPANPRAWKQYQPAISFRNRYIVDSLSRSAGIFVRHFYRRQASQIFTLADLKEKLLIDLYNKMMYNRLVVLNSAKDSVSVNMTHKFGNISVEAHVAALESALHITGSLSPSAVEEAFKKFFRMQETIRRYGFSKEELQQAKTELGKAFRNGGEISSHLLNEDYFHDYMGWSRAFSHKFVDSVSYAWLDSIHEDSMHELFKKWTATGKGDFIISAAPQLANLIPDSSQVTAWMDQSRDATVERFVPVKPVAPEPFLPAAQVASLKKHQASYDIQEMADIGTSIITYRNGLQLILKPVKSRSADEAKVKITAYKARGYAHYPVSDRFMAKQASVICMFSGVGGLSGTDLYNRIGLYGLNFSSHVKHYSTGLMVDAPPDNLESAFQLIHLWMTSPNRDAKSFEKAAAFLQASGNYSGRDSIIDCFLTGAPAGSHLRADRAYALMAELLGDANGFKFVVTGDFQPDSVIRMAAAYLGSIPARTGVKQGEAPKTPPRAITYERVTPNPSGGDEVGLEFLVKDKIGDADWMMLPVVDGLLNEKLVSRLREKMGGTYAVGVYVLKHAPDVFTTNINFNTLNRTPDEMIAACWEEIDALRSADLPREELDSFLRRQRLVIENNQRNQDFWQQYFQQQLISGRPLDEIERWREKLTTVDAKKIRELMYRILRSDIKYRLSK